MIVRRQTALFLDYDGTLVDLAATPEAAHPPQGLVPLLQRLAVALDGAIAIATEIGHGLLSTRGLLETDVPFSAEALLSGTGLPQLCRVAGFREGTRTAPEIIEFLRQATPPALRLGQLYAHLFARFAATAALTTGATGGVIVVGGLAKRLFPLLPTATLVSAFHLPGPMQDWLRDVSICQVTDDDVALKGLAGMPI